MNFLKSLFFGFAKIRQNFDNIWQNAIDKFKYLAVKIVEHVATLTNVLPFSVIVRITIFERTIAF